MHHYEVNKKHISISFGSPLLEYYLHRPLAHLSTRGAPGASLQLDVFDQVWDEGGRGVEVKKYILGRNLFFK